MRNAHNAALLAMFAEAERRENEEKARPLAVWDNVKRPIALDLNTLSQNLRKARA